MLKQHFPFAALAALALLFLLGELSMFIMALAAGVGLVPYVYGRDVDDIAARVRDAASAPELNERPTIHR